MADCGEKERGRKGEVEVEKEGERVREIEEDMKQRVERKAPPDLKARETN